MGRVIGKAIWHVNLSIGVDAEGFLTGHTISIVDIGGHVKPLRTLSEKERGVIIDMIEEAAGRIPR